MPVSTNKNFTFRANKGTELTIEEMDFNFNYLLLNNLISTSNFSDYAPAWYVIDYMYNNFHSINDVVLHDNLLSNEFKIYKIDSSLFNKVEVTFIDDFTNISFMITYDNNSIPDLITNNSETTSSFSFDFSSNGFAYLFVFANNGSNVDLVCSNVVVEN